jgi:hypothetical protein
VFDPTDSTGKGLLLSSSIGVFESTDGGVNWTLRTGPGLFTDMVLLRVPGPQGTVKVIAAAFGQALMTSTRTNGTRSAWTVINSPELPAAVTFDRVALTQQAENPTVMLALFAWYDLNVDAATQVAHALSVHRADVESDYFTTVDDLSGNDEPGAGMIGSVDFKSTTLYRYASVDIDALHRNVGRGLRDDEAPSTPAAKAAAFLHAYITSLPTGKINTFGNHTLPSAVIVKIRDRWPISFVNAFEIPVPKSTEGGFTRATCERLA